MRAVLRDEERIECEAAARIILRARRKKPGTIGCWAHANWRGDMILLEHLL